MNSVETSVNNIEIFVNDSRRLVALKAVHNFRDLGGYPTQSGQTTKWRTLYRADGLYRLTPEDARIVMSLGVHTVIDLRTHREVETRGTFPVEQHPVTFHHLPIIDISRSDTEVPEIEDVVEFLVSAYRDMLNIAAPRFAQAIGVIATTDVLPAVFHCAAGKDRTGILAALILGTLGVPDDIICADYGLTEAAARRFVEWAKVHQPELAALYTQIPARFAAADPRAMSIILTELHKKHGSIQRFVYEIGVSESTASALCASLLVPL